jgi:hypothetical protein
VGARQKRKAGVSAGSCIECAVSVRASHRTDNGTISSIQRNLLGK